jgi:protocatechuate 3,4-dioxygenase beta subunit
VRDQTAAVAGRVLDQQGEPVRGVEICAASLWGFDLACSRTDRQGYYTLSRLNLPPGRCRVGPADGRRRLLEIKPGRTRLGVDFTVQPAPGAE